MSALDLYVSGCSDDLWLVCIYWLIVMVLEWVVWDFGY